MTKHVVSIISRMNVGGPALLLAELFDKLEAPEYRHTLITGRCMENEIDFLKFHQINADVIYIDNIRRTSSPFADARSLFKLIRLLKILRPDIIHTHTSKAGFLGRIAAWLSGSNVPVLHTYHGHLLYGYFSRLKTSFIILNERILGRITTRFIAVTNQVKEDLLKVGIGPSNKWDVIYPGVTPPIAIDSNVAKYNLGLPADKFIVVWIGRFTSIKNPLLALEALDSLEKPVLEHIHLVMVGSGELFDESQKYASDLNLPVSFAGWISDVKPYLSSADILLMTSKNEGMPVVIIEAAFHHVATVSTNVGGVSEFIEESKTGYLSDESAESLAEQISLAMSDQVLRSRIADGAFELASNKFTTSAFALSHDLLYSTMLKVF